MNRITAFLRPLLLGITFLVVPEIAVAQQPAGKDTVPVGKDTVPVGKDAVPIGQGAVPIGANSVPVGQNSAPVGANSVPVGQNSVPVGTNSVPVGQGARPVGENSVPVGTNSRPIGENSVPVGANTRPVGENSVPVGTNSRPIGENSVPVGENSNPVGQDARPTSTAKTREFLRLAARQRAQENTRTAHLFSGASEERWPLSEARLAEAISGPNRLAPEVIAQRNAKDKAWGDQVRRLAGQPALTVFRAPFWENYGSQIFFPVPYTEGSTFEDWFRKPSWNEILSHLSLPASDTPFEYIYDRNVIFHGDVIYVNQESIASYADWVASGHRMANSAQKPEDSQWMALGSFLVSNSETTSLNPQAIQLTMDREGNIAGLYAH